GVCGSARGGMHRAGRAHRRGKAHLVDEDLDQVLDALGRDHDLGMVGPGAVPGLDGDVLLDLHALPPPPGRQTIKQTTGESRLQAAALSHTGRPARVKDLTQIKEAKEARLWG